MDMGSYRDILHCLVSNLVEFPDQIDIGIVENDDNITMQLKVAPSDMGKVIGKQGRIAKEIRVLLKSAGLRDNKRILVDILD